MNTRSYEKTLNLIEKHFSDWYKVNPENVTPFNGVVRIKRKLHYTANPNFSSNKEYYVIDGYIVDDEGMAYGTYPIIGRDLNPGFYEEFPAYPIESFNDLENGLFEVVKQY